MSLVRKVFAGGLAAAAAILIFSNAPPLQAKETGKSGELGLRGGIYPEETPVRAAPQTPGARGGKQAEPTQPRSWQEPKRWGRKQPIAI